MRVSSTSVSRNLSADILRVSALFLVITYHIYALTHNRIFNNELVDSLISYGGEIGVNIFFFLSGFGIWHSLNKQFKAELTLGIYKSYIKRRIIRVVPNYYFHLILTVIITSSAIYISKENWSTFITHLLFVHNLFITHHGAINGSLWTMAVIFQFYLIAPFIFIIQNKKPVLFYVVGIVSFIWPIIISGTFLDSLFYGSQITDRLHIFMIGMMAARFEYRKKNKNSNYIFLLLTVIAMLIFFYWVVLRIQNYHVLMPTFGCVFYGLIIYFMSGNEYSHGLFSRILLFLAKQEYGIYLWHFIIITTLISTAPLIMRLIECNMVILWIVLTLCSVFVGSLIQCVVDSYVSTKIAKK